MLTIKQHQQFQQDNWRKGVAVFRQAVDVSAYPLEPRTLCELATDELVESRLIDIDHTLSLGPFDFELPADASEPLLPEKAMLLVQCLEQHLTQIDTFIKDHFDFMPRWQIDDVMASFGDTGATCGAHFDQYDVFLVQHTGTKQWQLDDGGHNEDDLAIDAEIRLLESFSPTRTLTMNPGDVLYLPPGIGHYGVCPEPSITLSVGIRRPAQSELLAEISEFALEQTSTARPMTDGLYADGALPEIAINEISHQLGELLNPRVVERWYGCYVTRLREPDLMDRYVPEEGERLSQTLAVTLPTRLAWSFSDNQLLLFVNGEVVDLPASDQDWVKHLCETRAFLFREHIISPDGVACLEMLLATGALTNS